MWIEWRSATVLEMPPCIIRWTSWHRTAARRSAIQDKGRASARWAVKPSSTLFGRSFLTEERLWLAAPTQVRVFDLPTDRKSPDVLRRSRLARPLIFLAPA